MTVVALGSVRSCGATTLGVALAATWPTTRRVLLVEADPAGGTLAAGSGWPPEPGLVSLAAATRRAGDLALVFAHCHSLPGGAPVLAAPAAGDQARHVLSLLDGVLTGLGALDADVLLDCGRLEPTATASGSSGAAISGAALSNMARLAAADRAILVARPRLSDLHALGSWLAGRGAMALTTSDRLGLVLVGDGPYPDAEITDALRVEVLGRVPSDPEAASALLAVPADDRTLRRAPLVRAARSLAADLVGVEHSTDEPIPGPATRQARITSFRPWRSTERVAVSNGAQSSGAGGNGASPDSAGPEGVSR